MDKPLVFLDIDGVLNSHETLRKGIGNGLSREECYLAMTCPALVRRMAGAVAQCDAEVVISSAWRNFLDLNTIRRILEWRGWTNPPIVGKTPCYRGETRGYEIRSWMDENGGNRPFVIIDDDQDMLPGQPLIRTDPTVGFSEEDSRALVTVLTTPPV